MFTGIVEEAAAVTSVREGSESIEFAVESKLCSKSLKVGDSLAVNGCCLTVINLVGAKETTLQFDLLRETWKRTNLQFAHAGSLVNLERPLKAHGFSVQRPATQAREHDELVIAVWPKREWVALKKRRSGSTGPSCSWMRRATASGSGRARPGRGAG